MKKTISLLILACTLSACKKPETQSTAVEVPGAHFRQGHGVGLPDNMQKSLGIEVAEVTEKKIQPLFHLSLMVVHSSGDTSGDKNSQTQLEGWLSAEQAKTIQLGLPVQLTLSDGKTVSAVVQRILKEVSPTLGEFLVTVSTKTHLDPGTSASASIEAPAKGEVVVIPQSALLKTAEGEFVYAVNEKYFVRTPIKTGIRNDELIEVTDGLYSGDQIVVSQVTPVWMTELQTLRAGQACCKGH